VQARSQQRDRAARLRAQYRVRQLEPLRGGER
jgi:hypothetical protein